MLSIEKYYILYSVIHVGRSRHFSFNTNEYVQVLILEFLTF